jgi:hypothetical protein
MSHCGSTHAGLSEAGFYSKRCISDLELGLQDTQDKFWDALFLNIYIINIKVF